MNRIRMNKGMRILDNSDNKSFDQENIDTKSHPFDHKNNDSNLITFYSHIVIIN